MKKFLLIFFAFFFAFLLFWIMMVYRDVILPNSSNKVRSAQASGADGDEANLVEACTPKNYSVIEVSKDSAVISWQTDEECTGFILYGLNKDELGNISVNLGNSSTKHHQVKLESLQSGKSYYYVINSEGKTYGNNGLVMVLTTKEF